MKLWGYITKIQVDHPAAWDRQGRIDVTIKMSIDGCLPTPPINEFDQF